MPRLELPFPPSVNHYWRRVGNKTLISKAGRQFREWVEAMARHQGWNSLAGPLGISIEATPPDERGRDLDNLLKAPLDAMQHAGLYQDDNQLEEIHIYRMPPGVGVLSVDIWPIQGPCQGDRQQMMADLAIRAKRLQSELEATLCELQSLQEDG